VYSSHSSDWLLLLLLLLLLPLLLPLLLLLLLLLLLPLLMACPVIIMCINDSEDIDGTAGFAIKFDN
jgi:hypothetical protein